MERDLRSSLAGAVPDEARLSDLVHTIRTGVDGANAELHRIFYPGVCFLIRRRLGQEGVDRYAIPVLRAVARKIRGDNSINGGNLAKVVRAVLLETVPVEPRKAPAQESGGRSAVSAAEQILEMMSPVEKEALRRCYVMGEPPESVRNILNMTAEQLNEIRLRARVEFSDKTNVNIA